MKRHAPRPSLTIERGLHLLTHLRPPSRGPPSASSHSSSHSVSCPPSPNPTTPTFASAFQSFEQRMTPPSTGREARSRPSTPARFSPPWSPKMHSWGWGGGGRTPLLPLRGGQQGVSKLWPIRRWVRSRWTGVTLLALLVLVLLYLYYPPWPLSRTSTLPLSLLRQRQPDFPPTPWPPPPQDPHTRYLTYLPHSGLHNQLIELQNALLLAGLMGRVLLVPPLRVGRALGWGVVERTHQLLACGALNPRRGKDSEVDRADEAEQAGCEDQLLPDHAYLPFSSIFRLPPQSLVRTIPLTSPVLLPHQLEALNLTPSSIFHLPPSPPPASSDQPHTNLTPYQHKYYETAALQRPLGRYLSRVDLDQLAHETRHHAILSLSSLFGTSRIKLSSKPAKQLRREIKGLTTFTHPALLRAAEKAVNRLGGRDGYIAAHVRLGDGDFLREGQERVREVWWNLVRSLGLDDSLAAQVEHWAHGQLPAFDPYTRALSPNSNHVTADNHTLSLLSLGPPPPQPPEDRQALKHPHPPIPAFSSPPPRARGLRCPRPLHQHPQMWPLNVPLFLATPDADSPFLLHLLRTFPCTFTLSTPELQPLLQPVLRLETEAGQKVGKWLLGAVDALVASEGRWVVGTRGSTMSGWVGDVGWRGVRGWEVIARG